MYKNVIGFVNLHTSPRAGLLNNSRSLGSVTFLGRYAIIDFALSNFANSGIDRIATLVYKFPQSILGHTENGKPWLGNTKTGFFKFLYNEQEANNPNLNTPIANIIANRNMFVRHSYEYVVIAPAHYLMSIDYRPIIDEHIAQKRQVTAVYCPIHDGKTNFKHAKTVKLNKNNEIVSFGRNTKTKDEINVSLETFIISKKTFDDIIERGPSISKTSGFQDIIFWMIKNEGLKVHGHCFDHFVFPIMSTEEYIKNSFMMLSYEKRRKLFRDDWPIYTTSHDTPPSRYLDGADVKDSFISNGCQIEGKVEHSILSRNVVVKKGATVKNSIIFSFSNVEEGATLEYVITDKRVTVTKNKKVKGKANDPEFIKRGDII